MDIARRGEDGAWWPVRDLGRVRLAELHERLGLRVPATDAALPGADDAVGRAALAAIRHLRRPLDAALRHPVSDFLDGLPDDP
jgi:membrane protein